MTGSDFATDVRVRSWEHAVKRLKLDLRSANHCVAGIFFAMLMVGLAACTATGARVVTLSNANYARLSDFEFCKERQRGKTTDLSSQPCDDAKDRPKLGIALAGGGTKAASYGMGVLRGLYEQGILQKADIISSVSGGTYASYFYFTKLLADARGEAPDLQGGSRGLGAIFDDCLPKDYADLCAARAEDGQCEHPGLDRWKKDPGLEVCYTAAHRSAGETDRYRYQGHVRGFVNPLSDAPTFTSNRNPCGKAFALAGEGIVAGAFGAPWNLVANGLFDWRQTCSITASRYRRGLTRTYGSMPADCPFGDCMDSRPLPRPITPGPSLCDLASVWAKGESLRCPTAYGDAKCSVPLWVINTTIDYGFWPKILDFTGKDDVEISTFEITPIGFRSRMFGDQRGLDATRFCIPESEREGSHDSTSEPGAVKSDYPAYAQYEEVEGDGYWKTPRLEVAVAASAGFLDDQQREYRGVRVGQAALARLFSMNWGYDIPNEHVSRTRVRRPHKALPFPLYFLHGYSSDEHEVSIHLSDGGQTENLGLWALLRRRVRDIVVVDDGEDKSAELADLCRVNFALRERGLHLVFPKFADFDDPSGICFSKGARYLSVQSWRPAVVEGCVLPFGIDECSLADKDKDVWSHVFLVKAALDLQQGVIAEAKKACQPLRENIDDVLPEARTACWDKIEHSNPPLPVELVGYLTDSEYSPEDFPQGSTVGLTLDSNSKIFGAYRELGRWQARHLGIGEDGIFVSQVP